MADGDCRVLPRSERTRNDKRHFDICFSSVPQGGGYIVEAELEQLIFSRFASIFFPAADGEQIFEYRIEVRGLAGNGAGFRWRIACHPARDLEVGHADTFTGVECLPDAGYSVS